MCVTIAIALIPLTQLMFCINYKLALIKAIICACALESFYGLESCRSEIAMKTEKFLKAV